MPRCVGPPALQRPQGRCGGGRRRPARSGMDHAYAQAPTLGVAGGFWGGRTVASFPATTSQELDKFLVPSDDA
eukprot:9406798-Heterocapsa_arctica.AAC.1